MVRALALQARGHWFESSCFHQNNRGFPSVFCCPQQPSARHCAARLSAEPVTSHCSRSRKPHPPSPRLLFAFTLRRSAPFVCIPLPHAPSSSPVLLSLFRRSAPYESSCFHQKQTKPNFVCFFIRLLLVIFNCYIYNINPLIKAQIDVIDYSYIL